MNKISYILNTNRENVFFIKEMMIMAKAGMRRPDPNDPHGTESNHKPRYNKQEPTVPEIQGKAKTGNKKAGRII